jgi:glyoxylase-like metal-dependent hydrolase (beta-lactamase superfamily II)
MLPQRAATRRLYDCPVAKTLPITIVNVGYRSTNYWVVGAGQNRLLVDIGWPGTLGTMKSMLKRMDVPLREIRYALATHYHIDHAGLAEELKREGSARIRQSGCARHVAAPARARGCGCVSRARANPADRRTAAMTRFATSECSTCPSCRPRAE